MPARNVRFFVGFTSSLAFRSSVIFIVHLKKFRTTHPLFGSSSSRYLRFPGFGCGRATSFGDSFRRDLIKLGVHVKSMVQSASGSIDEKIKELGDWRGKVLAKVREIVHEADPEIVEEWKWVKATSPGIPVWSHGGIVCTGETYKNVVKMTFAKGAALKDPSGLFNSSLDGNVRRAIDIHESDKIDEAALKNLIRAAVSLNLMKSKPKAGHASSKRAG